MAVEHLLESFMMVLIFNTGSRAVDTVVMETEASVQLDIQSHDLSKIDVLYWNKDSTTIVTYISKIKELMIDSSYKHRVDFNAKTFSLTLRNMQNTDSGTYTARSRQEDTYEDVAEYRVSVIEYIFQDEFTPRFPIMPIIVMFVVAGLPVFCVLVVYCCCSNKEGVQQGDKTDYDDVETLVHKQEMSEDTWTTVMYQ